MSKLLPTFLSHTVGWQESHETHCKAPIVYRWRNIEKWRFLPKENKIKRKKQTAQTETKAMRKKHKLK